MVGDEIGRLVGALVESGTGAFDGAATGFAEGV
jgi:hypothetical protein